MNTESVKPDPGSQIVIHRLGTIGYKAGSIPRPESQDKSADLWAQCGDDCLVVEVKSRVDDAPTQSQLQREPVGTIVEREGSIGRKNWLSAVVEDAARQIQASQD